MRLVQQQYLLVCCFLPGFEYMGQLQPDSEEKIGFLPGFDVWWLVAFGKGQTFELSRGPFLTARLQALAVGHRRERGFRSAGEQERWRKTGCLIVGELWCLSRISKVAPEKIVTPFLQRVPWKR